LRLGAIGDLVAGPRGQRDLAAAAELGFEDTLEHVEDMTFRAPMIGPVAGGIFDHPHADVAELPGAPARDAALAGVDRLRYVRPIGGAERDIADLHECLSRSRRALCAVDSPFGSLHPILNES
jgi:hypothetical protein